MALLAKGTWIVVADGEKALLLENQGTPAAPKLQLHEKFEQEAPPTRELGTDRPGRMPDPGKSQLSAMEETDLQRVMKERFVAELAERVNTLVAKGKVSKLVLAAPPQSLGVLRSHLSAAASAAVIASLSKTLTHHTVEKIGTVVAADIDQL